MIPVGLDAMYYALKQHLGKLNKQNMTNLNKETKLEVRESAMEGCGLFSEILAAALISKTHKNVLHIFKTF